ncbi:hypothetical protein NKH47_01895 [Mesorhizobium sp. M1060]|uniref:hypothetical protein n=1 Tax=Mesorhizobium sp. M1060 TaxID=2957052 RepID=UPI0033372251
MNRSQRRKEKWATLNPRQPYADFLASMGDDTAKVMMVMLRQMTGIDAPFDDATLWNAIRELINAGLLKVWFRTGPQGVQVMPEFIIPNDNDNAKKGAA